MAKTPRVYHQRNFLDLLNDAIILAEIAEQSEAVIEKHFGQYSFGGWPEVSLARTSIISSAFCLESAANCCIHTLQLGPSLSQAVDKQSIFKKFEIFLERISSRSLNQDPVVVGRAKEVIDIRNTFAHSKVVEAKMQPIPGGGWDWEVGGFKYHGFKRNFICQAPDAVAVLRSVTDFLSYYFTDRCQLSPLKVCRILVDFEPVELSEEHVGPVNFQVPEFIRASERWGLSLGFFGGP